MTAFAGPTVIGGDGEEAIEVKEGLTISMQINKRAVAQRRALHGLWVREPSWALRAGVRGHVVGGWREGVLPRP